MKLVDDWRAILLRGWNIRASILVALIVGLATATPQILEALDFLPPLWRALIVTVLTAAGLIASRIIAQPKTLGGSDARQ